MEVYNYIILIIFSCLMRIGLTTMLDSATGLILILLFLSLQEGIIKRLKQQNNIPQMIKPNIINHIILCSNN